MSQHRACPRHPHLEADENGLCVTCRHAIPQHMRSLPKWRIERYLAIHFTSIRVFGGGRKR